MRRVAQPRYSCQGDAGSLVENVSPFFCDLRASHQLRSECGASSNYASGRTATRGQSIRERSETRSAAAPLTYGWCKAAHISRPGSGGGKERVCDAGCGSGGGKESVCDAGRQRRVRKRASALADDGRCR
ncbi:hypothetical protein MRX96_003774 [Rhipicephalus microplus]